MLDAPYEAIRDAYIPFENGFEELPALFVDRDTGAQLRPMSGEATLTLEATRHEGDLTRAARLPAGTLQGVH